MNMLSDNEDFLETLEVKRYGQLFLLIASYDLPRSQLPSPTGTMIRWCGGFILTPEGWCYLKFGSLYQLQAYKNPTCFDVQQLILLFDTAHLIGPLFPRTREYDNIGKLFRIFLIAIYAI